MPKYLHNNSLALMKVGFVIILEYIFQKVSAIVVFFLLLQRIFNNYNLF